MSDIQWLMPLHQILQFLLFFFFTPVVCCVCCFHSCWCVEPAISMCRISKPMLLSLEAHGTSERRCVAKHVFVLSHVQHSVRLTQTLVPCPLWCGHIRVQNKTTCQWWSQSASKQTLVWSDCPDSVHETCCGFWVVGNIFWYASCKTSMQNAKMSSRG